MGGRGWRTGQGDLLLCLAWLGVSWLVVLTPGLRTSILRLVVVLPLVLFWPGYTVVAALFPHGIEGERTPDGEPGPIELLLLAVGVSVAMGIFLGTALALSPVGLTPLTSLLGVTIVILCGLAVAVIRRSIDWDDLVLSERLGAPDDRPSEGDDFSDSFLTGSGDPVGYVVAALVVLAALGGGGGMLALAAHEPAGYTEFAVLPEAGATNLSAGDYEAALASDDGLLVRVGNHHSQARTYVVEVTVQRATRAEDGVVVQDRRELAELTVTVGAGETETRTTDNDIPWSGATRRVVYRLYRVDGVERTVVARTHVWLNASDMR